MYNCVLSVFPDCFAYVGQTPYTHKLITHHRLDNHPARAGIVPYDTAYYCHSFPSVRSNAQNIHQQDRNTSHRNHRNKRLRTVRSHLLYST